MKLIIYREFNCRDVGALVESPFCTYRPTLSPNVRGGRVGITSTIVIMGMFRGKDTSVKL